MVFGSNEISLNLLIQEFCLFLRPILKYKDKFKADVFNRSKKTGFVQQTWDC
jgi:hypothetical protein